MDNNVNILLIGIGPHARRIYIPAINKYKANNAHLVAGVELIKQKESLLEYLKQNNLTFAAYFIERFDPNGILPSNIENLLNQIVTKHHVNAVIIATEPLVHKHYAQWALTRGLHILMDKPITTHDNIVSSISNAKQLISDYKKLYQQYLQLQKTKETIFSINVQRRYHPGFIKVFDLIKDVTKKFNIPVTSIQSQHADGQWRLPNEIITQTYHPYYQGYGKCSHSGYHIFDVVYQLYKSGYVEGKFADEFEIVSSFIQPNGFIKQICKNDYIDYFGEEYKLINKLTDKELSPMCENFGEVDASCLLTLKKEKENVGNITINLLHNSFARRTWVLPGEDLYKGNGRVKHEFHSIQQGPFQNIQIHSYQSKDNHKYSTDEDYEVGGNNHFDIYVFRNAQMFGKKQKPLEIIHLNELVDYQDHNDNSLVHETTKEQVVLEFINFVQGKVAKNRLRSNIDSHLIPVSIMSAVCQSHIKRKNGGSPIVSFRNGK